MEYYILEYLKKDWRKMREIKEEFGISHDGQLRRDISSYNNQYDAKDKPYYIVSSIAKGYHLTRDTDLIKESADYHMQLAIVHLKKYWQVVKMHETKDNLMLDLEKKLNE